MGTNLEKKKDIFHRYSANLDDYLVAIGKGIFDDTTGERLNVTDKLYLCPLCYRIFLPQHLEDCGDQNFLTIEHNPPKKMGGSGPILTCKECNNKNGTEYDKLVRDLLVTESFLYSDNASISAKINVDSNPIKGRVQKKGTAVYLQPSHKSNPYAYRQLQNAISDSKPLQVTFNLHVPDWTEYSIGMLKIAYLKAFEYFGYHFADQGNAADIREVLNKTKEYPAPNNGVMDIFAPDDFIGIHVVVEPKELKALIITQQFIFEHDNNLVKKNVPVVLPAPFEGGWDLLANYSKFLNKEIAFKSERFSLKQIPLQKCEQYYSMFINQ